MLWIHPTRSLLLRVWSQTRPGPVKSVTRPSPPRMVDFQLPALRTENCTVSSNATTWPVSRVICSPAVSSCDRIVVPVVRRVERRFSPPFGLSVLVVGQVA